MARMVVLDGYTLNPGDNPWDELMELGDLTVHDRTPVGEVVKRAAGAEIVLTNKTPVSAEAIKQLPELKLIAVLATGYNVVDIEAAAERGIAVVNVPEYSTDTVAQFVFALLLALCHRVERHSESVHAGQWTRSEDFMYALTPQVELAGMTMGVVGFGRIGRRVAELADAFGMRVRVSGRTPKPLPALRDVAWCELDELLEASDVVSLHCPQTAETKGMVDTAFLERMKQSAFLVNTSRGGLVVEADLASALKEKHIAGAAVDVASSEPMAKDSALLGVRNLIVTPHLAWSALAAR